MKCSVILLLVSVVALPYTECVGVVGGSESPRHKDVGVHLERKTQI